MIQTPTNYATPTSVLSRDALDATHKSNRYRQMIYEQICLQGTNGMTCDEIEVRLGIRHQTASCFISVLKDKGMIVASGQTRPARSGRNVTVWTRKFSGVVAPSTSELFPVKPTFKQGGF
jgi:predicted ArsR family transcriptional regulator